MHQITKELALALVKSSQVDELPICPHCEQVNYYGITDHTTECIVTRAKILLDVEWGIKS